MTLLGIVAAALITAPAHASPVKGLPARTTQIKSLSAQLSRTTGKTNDFVSVWGAALADFLGRYAGEPMLGDVLLRLAELDPRVAEQQDHFEPLCDALDRAGHNPMTMMGLPMDKQLLAYKAAAEAAQIRISANAYNRAVKIAEEIDELDDEDLYSFSVGLFTSRSLYAMYMTADVLQAIDLTRRHVMAKFHGSQEAKVLGQLYADAISLKSDRSGGAGADELAPIIQSQEGAGFVYLSRPEPADAAAPAPTEAEAVAAIAGAAAEVSVYLARPQDPWLTAPVQAALDAAAGRGIKVTILETGAAEGYARLVVDGAGVAGATVSEPPAVAGPQAPASGGWIKGAGWKAPAVEWAKDFGVVLLVFVSVCVILFAFSAAAGVAPDPLIAGWRAMSSLTWSVAADALANWAPSAFGPKA